MLRAELKEPDSKRYVYTVRRNSRRGRVVYVGVTHDFTERFNGHRNSGKFKQMIDKGVRLFMVLEEETTYADYRMG